MGIGMNDKPTTKEVYHVAPELAKSNLPKEAQNELTSVSKTPPVPGNTGGDLNTEYRQCPRCGDKDCERYHHVATYPAPECWYWECPTCAHQWGHE